MRYVCGICPGFVNIEELKDSCCPRRCAKCKSHMVWSEKDLTPEVIRLAEYESNQSTN